MTTGTVAAIGEEARVRGYGLAGVAVLAADEATAVHAAWRSLGPDVAVVILTPHAARVLRDAVAGADRMVAVLPEAPP